MNLNGAATPTAGLSVGQKDDSKKKELPDFIAEKVLKTCQTVKQVREFLTKLRNKVAASSNSNSNSEEAKASDNSGKSLLRLQGEVVSVAHVEAAARLVKKEMEQRKEQQREVAKTLSSTTATAATTTTTTSSTTSSSSTLPQLLPPAAASAVEGGSGEVVAATAAVATATATATASASSAASKQTTAAPHSASMKALDNHNFLFQTVIQKARDYKTAIRFIRYLEVTAGKVNKSGRLYTKEEVQTVSDRVKRWFRDRSKKVMLPAKRSNSSSSSSESSSEASSDSSSSSSGESDDSEGEGERGRPKKGKSKWWKQHKRSFANDVDDVLFGSDDEELSGEESVDEEEKLGPSAAAAMRKDLLDVVPMQQARLAAAANDGYPTDWAGCPKVGTVGFNNHAARIMLRFGVGVPKKRSPTELRRLPCAPLQPHQESAVFLLHPKSPVSRLLVDHPTGSGKTRVMIASLNNFFFDPRPKVPIFPKEPVCENFYRELLRWPNRYRDFFCCMKSKLVVPLAGGRDWRKSRNFVWHVDHLGDQQLKELCREMRETLEMKTWFYMGKMRKSKYQEFQKRCPGEALPAAPLRALRYSSAGGQHTAIREFDQLPQSALFKIGFSRRDPNVYSNKIVMMDEVHNLVRKETQYFEQLSHLRELLEGCSNTVLAGFTATPILAEAQEGQELLRIIKGKHFSSGCDEGFISSFPMRPLDLFPQALPLGIPDAILTPSLQQQVVRKVTLFGESLLKLDEKRALGVALRRQRAYCNLSVHFGSLHNGKSGSKARVLGHFDLTAPKLHAIAEDVMSEDTKALVLVDRRTGCEALVEFLKTVGVKRGFGVATLEEREGFNCSSTNLRGEKYRVLVADASTASEGVSFFGVRRVFLADVPVAPSALVQSVGRALRMYSHAKLSPEERTVTTYMYVSGFPAWMRSALGNWCLRAQKHERVDPTATISKARSLLRAFRRAGISELDDLKQQLDDYGEKVQPKNDVVDVDSPPASSSAATALTTAASTSASSASALGASSSSSSSSSTSKPVITEDLPLSALAKLARGPNAATAAGARKSDSSSSVLRSSSSSLSLLEGSSQLGGSQDDDKAFPSKQNLDPNLCIAFLDSIGLRKHAAQIRSAGQALLFGAKSGATSMGFGNVPVRRQRGKRRRGPPRQPQRLPQESGVPRLDKIKKGLEAQAKAIRRHPVVRALRALYMAHGPQVHEELNLQPATADEVTLKDLAEKTRTFAPALSALRAKAIDRQVLLPLAKVQGVVKAEEMSDGEDENERWEDHFALSSDSSGDEDMAAVARQRTAEMPLILPPGWRIEQAVASSSSSKAAATPKFGKNGRMLSKKASVSRVFVSPAGVRYRSEAQVKAAISGARKAQRVAERLKSEYRRKFGKLEEGKKEEGAGGGKVEGEERGKVEESAERALKRSDSDSSAPAPVVGEAKVEVISPQKQQQQQQQQHLQTPSKSSSSNSQNSPKSQSSVDLELDSEVEMVVAPDDGEGDEAQLVESSNRDIQGVSVSKSDSQEKEEDNEEGAKKEEEDVEELQQVKQESSPTTNDGSSPLKTLVIGIKEEPAESPSKGSESDASLSTRDSDGTSMTARKERGGGAVEEEVFVKEEGNSDDEEISPKKEEAEDPDAWIAVKMETLTPEKSRAGAVVAGVLETPPQKRRRLGAAASDTMGLDAPISIV